MEVAMMTRERFYAEWKRLFSEFLKKESLSGQAVSVTCRSLSPEEAIGQTKRKDFPILTGKEVMIQAEVDGAKGQAFTSAPVAFSGTLEQLLDIDMVHDAGGRSMCIAALNAVMRAKGLCRSTVHCRKDGPEQCACDMRSFLDERYPDHKRVVLVGYQPALLEMLAKTGRSVRVLDLNPANIGQIRYGVPVEDGVSSYPDAVSWADLILCTGSTVCNGSIVQYLDLPVDVVFYGTTLAGTAILMHLNRVCFADRYEEG
jgi:uncharacterized protein (DUF4213/DUF364 family)